MAGIEKFECDNGALGLRSNNYIASDDQVLRVYNWRANTVQFALTGSGAPGFWGTTPPTSRTTFTQTYSTADATISAYTADTETTAYSGGSTDAALALNADLNALRAAYETLRAHAEDVGKAVNSIVDALQAVGIVA